MTQAPRDENSVTGLLAVLNTDTVQGTTLVPLCINQAGRSIRINYTATINFTMQPVDPRDENYATCWLFKGSDGLTYPAVADSEGKLLVAIN
jgi:hypothetical protein